MQPGSASLTAEFAAAFRAVEHVRRPVRARLFEDPLAIRFCSPGVRAWVRYTGLPAVGGLARARVERISSGALSSGIARTRLIDDHLRAAIGSGIGQVVLLGAGYDCRATRLPELARLRVVEIDHPDTQTVKRRIVAEALGRPPDNVLYRAADLTREELGEVLAGCCGDLPGRAAVIWEGVAHYLGDRAVDGTIRSLARFFPGGSRLIFTYLDRRLLDGSLVFPYAREALERCRAAGEPWIFGLDPAETRAYLAARGFRLRDDLGADDYRRRYWGEAARRYSGFGFYRAALAEKA